MVKRRRVILSTSSNQLSFFFHSVPHKGPKLKALYNPVVGANIMSDNFALAFLCGEALALTGRTLRGPSGSLVGSYGVIQNVSKTQGC
jgi:hypothetical protein